MGANQTARDTPYKRKLLLKILYSTGVVKCDDRILSSANPEFRYHHDIYDSFSSPFFSPPLLSSQLFVACVCVCVGGCNGGESVCDRARRIRMLCSICYHHYHYHGFFIIVFFFFNSANTVATIIVVTCFHSKVLYM